MNTQKGTEKVVRGRSFRTRHAWVIGFAAAMFLGCAAHGDHMRPGTPGQIVPDAQTATIVFLRPSGFAGGIVPVIATAQGRFLGESEASSYFVAKLPPGEHLIFSWSESTPALRANVAAGATYFVEVAPKMGAFSSRVQLIALTPRSENWAKRTEWMSESRPLTTDEAAGQEYVRSRADDFAERIRDAQESLKDYSAEDLAERTLRPEDGIREGSAAAPAAVPPAAPPPAPSAPAPAPAAEDPKPKSTIDQVMLKSGGRVRGVVMADEPSSVSVRLADGSVKKLKRADVDRVEYANAKQ